MKDHHVAAFMAALLISDGIPAIHAIDTAVNTLLRCAVLLADAKETPQESGPASSSSTRRSRSKKEN